MATTTVVLERRNIAASVKSLQVELAKAKFDGVTATTRKGAVHVQMPIARLGNLRFSYGGERCLLKMSNRKAIAVKLKGFVMEQQAHDRAFHLVFRAAKNPPARAAGEDASPIRRAFFERSMRAVKELQSLDEKTLANAVQSPTDYSVLVSALSTDEALAGIRPHDPLAGARLRGLEAKRKLLDCEGGPLSTAEVGEALRISRQAVDRRRKEHKLLGVQLGKKGFHYPAWQIGLPHFEEVLQTLRDRDSWEQLGFFLNPSALLKDRAPLDVLRGGKSGIGDILRAAAAYGEQGA